MAEIAELLGVSRSYINRLARSGALPEPLGQVTAGRIWKREDIEAWARETGRSPRT